MGGDAGVGGGSWRLVVMAAVGVGGGVMSSRAAIVGFICRRKWAVVGVR